MRRVVPLLLLVACATEPRPRPATLDPSDPNAPSSPPPRLPTAFDPRPLEDAADTAPHDHSPHDHDHDHDHATHHEAQPDTAPDAGTPRDLEDAGAPHRGHH